ncbi:MAG TPA: sugar ABC transporter substrate-binding protein [Ruminiclostridium sp.]|nr:sugar ABC transporter substrate-binding protein [Ruminiclostridium sp.]
MYSFRRTGLRAAASVLILLLGISITSCDGNRDITPDVTSITRESVKITVPDAFGIKITDTDSGGTLQGQYNGRKIIVGTKQGEEEAALKKVTPYFEKVSGAQVEIRAYPDSEYMNKVATDLSSGHKLDVICMPVALIHSYAESGYLQDLTPFVNDKNIASPNLDINDFIPNLLDVYGMYNGTFYALPYKPDAQILFYRKDLFDSEKIKQEYRKKVGKALKVPDTIDELYETAKFFTQSFNPDSPTQYGFNMLGKRFSRRYTFYNRLAAYGGKVVDKDLNPGFNNVAGVSAMKTYLELAKYCTPDWLNFGFEEANDFFISGNVAMMEQWPGLSKIAEGEGSKVKGKVGYAVVPGVNGVKAPTLGGWAVAITKTQANPELDYKFIEYITSKDMELLKISAGCDPCRTSNFMRPEIVASNPMYPILEESLASAKILADPDVPLITTKLIDIQEDSIFNVVTGKATPEAAIRSMAEDFRKEIKAAGLSR